MKSHVKGAGIFETHELSGLLLSSNEFSNQDMDITPPESSEIGYFETQENNELKPENILKRKKKSSSKNKNKSKEFSHLMFFKVTKFSRIIKKIYEFLLFTDKNVSAYRF